MNMVSSMTNPTSTLNPMNMTSPMNVIHQNAWMDSGYKEEELVSIQLPKAYMEQYCATLINREVVPEEGSSWLVIFFWIFISWWAGLAILALLFSLAHIKGQKKQQGSK